MSTITSIYDKSIQNRRVLIVGLIVLLTMASTTFLLACSPRASAGGMLGRAGSNPMLQPGDMIGDMLVTTDVEQALPLWNICSSTAQTEYAIHMNCGELPSANIAIGYPFGVRDFMNWDAFHWELSVDGHLLNLQAFGVQDLTYWDLAPHPSPVREVFRWYRLWSVVLADPTPGNHEVQGKAWSDDGEVTYTWVVDFTVTRP